MTSVLEDMTSVLEEQKLHMQKNSHDRYFWFPVALPKYPKGEMAQLSYQGMDFWNWFTHSESDHKGRVGGCWRLRNRVWNRFVPPCSLRNDGHVVLWSLMGQMIWIQAEKQLFCLFVCLFWCCPFRWYQTSHSCLYRTCWKINLTLVRIALLASGLGCTQITSHHYERGNSPGRKYVIK